jgi:hypothetical protein
MVPRFAWELISNKKKIIKKNKNKKKLKIKNNKKKSVYINIAIVSYNLQLSAISGWLLTHVLMYYFNPYQIC